MKNELTIIRSESAIEDLMSQRFNLPTHVLMEIHESFEDLIPLDARVESIDDLYEALLKESGLTGEVHLVPDANNMMIAGIMIMPNQLEGSNRLMAFYNQEFMKHMDEKHIKAAIGYAINSVQLQLNKELVGIDLKKGIYSYKGTEYTVNPSDVIKANIADCPPWRQDLLKIQCNELGIELTNEAQQLTGINAETFTEAMQQSEVRYQKLGEYRAKAHKVAKQQEQI